MLPVAKLKKKYNWANPEAGFYLREDWAPPHNATKVRSLLSPNESFHGKWIKLKVWLTGLLGHLIYHKWIFSVGTVNDIVYARNPAKMVHKRSLSWNGQTTMQRCVHDCVFTLTKMCQQWRPSPWAPIMSTKDQNPDIY